MCFQTACRAPSRPRALWMRMCSAKRGTPPGRRWPRRTRRCRADEASVVARARGVRIPGPGCCAAPKGLTNAETVRNQTPRAQCRERARRLDAHEASSSRCAGVCLTKCVTAILDRPAHTVKGQRPRGFILWGNDRSARGGINTSLSYSAPGVGPRLRDCPCRSRGRAHGR